MSDLPPQDPVGPAPGWPALGAVWWDQQILVRGAVAQDPLLRTGLGVLTCSPEEACEQTWDPGPPDRMNPCPSQHGHAPV